MRLRELYKSKKLDISIELFPPKTQEGVEKLFEKVQELKTFHPSFFSMTYGAAGSTSNLTLELVNRLKNQEKVETMCHLTIVGQSKIQIHQILDYLQQFGITNIIALRGDPPKGQMQFEHHSEGYQHAIDLVRVAKKRKFSVAVAGFPEMHPDSPNRESDIRYLKEKVDAGADVIITQLFFDNQHFFEYLEHVRKAGISIPVIPGLLPILSVSQVQRFTTLSKSKIPPHVQNELEKHRDDDKAATQYGIELTTHQCEGLMKAGVPGLHFYALNKSYSVQTVLKNLGLA